MRGDAALAAAPECRDRKLARAGYRVQRVEAAQVMLDLAATIAKIAAACAPAMKP